jgi:hypothetical protein
MLERLVAYYGADPHHVASDLREIKSCGCTGIVFCVTEIDVDLFPGRIEAVLRQAKKFGLDVYLNFWGLGGCFATNLMPSKYVCHNPDVRRTGFNSAVTSDNEDSPYVPRACFNNPKFLRWVVAFTSNFIKKHPVKGIFWDEPKPGFCRCRYCRERFRLKYGKDMPEEVTEKVEEKFYEDITGFLHILFQSAKEAQPEIVNMLCLMPGTAEDIGRHNLEGLLADDSLDVYGTDPYWIQEKKSLAWVAEKTADVVRLCHRYNKRSHIWIQSHNIPEGREKEVYEATLLAAGKGPDIIAAWGFRGNNCNLSSANPDRVWEEQKKAFRKLRNRGIDL